MFLKISLAPFAARIEPTPAPSTMITLFSPSPSIVTVSVAVLAAVTRGVEPIPAPVVQET